MIYQPAGLRCKATINGKEQDWDNHTKGAVYESPYVKIKNGVMEINDGVDGYRVDFKGDCQDGVKLNFNRHDTTESDLLFFTDRDNRGL